MLQFFTPFLQTVITDIFVLKKRQIYVKEKRRRRKIQGCQEKCSKQTTKKYF